MAEYFEKALELADEIEEYYFKNPDESKLPSPPHESHYGSFDENGQMIVENISAFWLRSVYKELHADRETGC